MVFTVPWIQVYSNLPQHPKVIRLADALGLTSAAVRPDAVAVGMLVSLWTWAAQNAPDGDLSRVSPRAVAEACSWRRAPQKLLDALTQTGFLDPDGRLHDWDVHERLYMDALERRREQTRERVRRYRARSAENGGAGAACNAENSVTGVTCNAENSVTSVTCNAKKSVTSVTCNATIPNRTIPEQNVCLLEERKRKERSAFAESFYAGCEGSLLRTKAVIAVMEARQARSRGDEAAAARWIAVAEAGGLKVDAQTLEYEG